MNMLELQSDLMSLTSIIKLISVKSVKECNNLQGCFHTTTQGVTVGISTLANLFSVLWNSVSTDALVNI